MSIKYFTKNEMLLYLNSLGKEYKRLHGEEIELIILGGASIVLNYGFRHTTTDIDSFYANSAILKDAIRTVANRHDLPLDWINSDFKRTASFSAKIVQFSKPYKTFSNIIHTRVVSSEYLIAMKMASFRTYKNDRSDIIGIIKEEKSNGNKLTVEIVKKAIHDLYNDNVSIDEDAWKLVKCALDENDLDLLFYAIRRDELENENILLSNKKTEEILIDERDDIAKQIELMKDIDTSRGKLEKFIRPSEKEK